MAPKQTCGAHEELTENIKHLRAGQDKLFDLDREKADSLSNIRESVVRIEERSNAGFLSLTNQLQEYDELHRHRHRRHWRLWLWRLQKMPTKHGNRVYGQIRRFLRRLRNSISMRRYTKWRV